MEHVPAVFLPVHIAALHHCVSSNSRHPLCRRQCVCHFRCLLSRRAGPDGLHAFMGCGDLEGGEAWTFTCPPGHRIVGYSGSTLVVAETNAGEDGDTTKDNSVDVGAVYIACIAADFEEPS
jgi:hypothetical protein